MTKLPLNRRNALRTLATGVAATSGVPLAAQVRRAVQGTTAPERPASPANAGTVVSPWSQLVWARGVEGQRRPDLGNGTFLNPIIPGDHADPTVLKDGADYWMVFSSYGATPGIPLWHSRDLVNWRLVTSILPRPPGVIWACDLAKVDGRYYVYLTTRSPNSIYVIHAASPTGPWSEPIDFKLHHHIDPGHVVGENGTRWLFLSGGDRVRLAPDGLSTAGEIEHAYDAWRYPDTWITEGYYPEGPKLVRRGPWFYIVTAVGGTSGPPTGHMVVAARSRSIDGPWEQCPYNPIVRTGSSAEKWWSRGHATLVEGPRGDWWLIYHGYENGFKTLGRATLLDPVRWTDDGWFVAQGGDLSSPLPKPLPDSPAYAGDALSDDFRADRAGVQWSFASFDRADASRRSIRDGTLFLAGRGSSPADSNPLVFVVPDLGYRVEVSVQVDANTRAGLILYYDRNLFCGVALDGNGVTIHSHGDVSNLLAPAGPARQMWLAISNVANVVTVEVSDDGTHWRRVDPRMEVSGFHHDTAGGYTALRPGLYSAGTGTARFRDFRYRALSIDRS